MLASAQPRRKPGRPKALYAGFDDDAFQEVEQARTSLAAMGKPSTIKAGIRFILDDLARATGAGMWRHEDGAYGRLRAAYGRGKRRAAKA